MAHPAIDEILTLNTLPTVLNRDVQRSVAAEDGCAQIERWLSLKLAQILELETRSATTPIRSICRRPSSIHS